MIVKRLLFGLITLYGLLTMFFSISSANYAVNFNGLGENLKNKLVGLHFGGGGNNFGGMFFITELKDISDHSVTINLGSHSRTNCKKELRGYYWNSLRGGIIYTLDKQTMDYWNGVDSSYYNGLAIDGGFYTACDGDENSIYGQIKYSGTNITNYTIQAGRKYDININTVTGNNFAENFQLYHSNKILGLIVDSNYGVAFVGGKVNSKWNELVSKLNTDTINDVITSIGNNKINNIVLADIDTVYSLLVQTTIGILGNFNIMGQKDHNVRQDVKLLQKQNNAVLGGQNIVNVSTAINRARKNVAKLCAGNWQDLAGNKIDIDSSYIGKTICVKDGDVKVNVDLTQTTTKPTNIIVKGKNRKVIFNTNQRQGKGYVNVFVDNGYVLFNNDINNILAIGKNGDLNGTPVTSGFVFKGNIISNGLIAGYDNINTKISSYPHKLYIKGSLLSLNTIGENPSRLKYLKNDLLGSFYTNNTMKIQNSFTWRCLDTGSGTDGVNCLSIGDMYSNNAIIIQKDQYNNPLLR